MHANKREEVADARAGEIVAVGGFKNVVTGDTVCDFAHPLLLGRVVFPEPVVHIAIEPKTKADEDKLSQTLDRLALEDPTFRVRIDPESGQTIISGMGELHLEVLVDRMMREFRVEANVGKPQVAYRETISKSARAEETLERQVGGKGQFASVTLALEPLERGLGLEFVSQIASDVLPTAFVRAVEEGVLQAMRGGVIAGYEMVDVKARLIAASHREDESNEIAFKIASSIAFKKAVRRAGPMLLEPVMKVEVMTPDDYMGAVVGDLNARGGKIQNMQPRGGSQLVRAFVSLAQMFGYATALRSVSQGRATYSMEFSHYAEAPRAIQERYAPRQSMLGNSVTG
jgi:elongation factor G